MENDAAEIAAGNHGVWARVGDDAMKCARLLMGLLATLGLSCGAQAGGGLMISEPQLMLMPSAASGGATVSMLIRNTGPAERLLVGARSPVANAVELHTTFAEAGEGLRMRPVRQIVIPAKGERRLTQRDLHVMLIGLQQPLHEGQAVALVLMFDGGQAETVEAIVKTAAQTGAPASK